MKSLASSIVAFVFGVAALLATLASPLSVAGTEAPNAALEQAPVLAKCGEAKLSVLFWDVYESTLYTPDGIYESGVRPLRLEIRYLRDIKGIDLVKQTGKEWRDQGLEDPRHTIWLGELLSLWPDVSKGDVITLDLDESGIARFSFNDDTLGSITDPDFGRDFAGIWLSPNTTRPELRAALIGREG